MKTGTLLSLLVLLPWCASASNPSTVVPVRAQNGAQTPDSKSRACIVSCRAAGPDLEVCYYDLKSVCGRREPECVESETRDCHPRMSNLGSWNPGLNQYEYPR